MTDLQPITLIAIQAARYLGLSEDDVIAFAVTKTDVVLVFRQGWKRRVPLSELAEISPDVPPTVPAETLEDEPKAESTVPDLQPEAAADEGEEPVRPRRRRGA
jgi:hypothetical protein